MCFDTSVEKYEKELRFDWISKEESVSDAGQQTWQMSFVVSHKSFFVIVVKKSIEVLCKYVCFRFENRHFFRTFDSTVSFPLFNWCLLPFSLNVGWEILSFLSWSYPGNRTYLFLSSFTPREPYKFHILDHNVLHPYNQTCNSFSQIFVTDIALFVCQLTRVTSSNLSRGFLLPSQDYSSIQSW